jgi:hypothetical protein
MFADTLNAGTSGYGKSDERTFRTRSLWRSRGDR